MATADEVRDRAANDLGLLRLGQSLQAQDTTRIENGYTEVYAKLKKHGLATWASDADVPDEIAPYVVTLVADNCLGTYGVSKDRFDRIKLAAATALKEIRQLITPDYVSQDEATGF
jgi:hypothetical protein